MQPAHKGEKGVFLENSSTLERKMPLFLSIRELSSNSEVLK